MNVPSLPTRMRSCRKRARKFPFKFLWLSHTRFHSSARDHHPSSVAASQESASKLYLAGGKGLVLHGDSAVGAQHGDAQLLLSVLGLLVPLLHRRRLKGGDHCHLKERKKIRGWKGEKKWSAFFCSTLTKLLTLKMFFQQLQRNMDRFQFGIQFKAKFFPVPLTDSHGSIILLHA